jgi:hypothetical protein
MHALRSETHKLIVYESKPERELYDLVSDPHERHNLYNDPEAAPIREALEKRLASLEDDLQFAPREVRLLKKAWIVGPVAESDEASLRESLLAGHIPDNARLVSQPFDLEALGIAPGDSFYVAIPIERLTPFDPYVTFEFIPPGAFRKYQRKELPFAAFDRDGLFWMNRPYAQSLGQPYEPIGLFNEKSNYPIASKTATAVFRGIAPSSPRSFQIETQAPAGQVIFLPPTQ